ncbi:DUF1403 family protein [Sulfitobacter sp. F26204]|uniref:DUF1403 family protein n=1 Tax=Sulfitobacter sp. F26204 TaxID=2996014 RepID=UPI00225DE62A|nr:DUF1403 family protein [Sulfitobacter sp. F26204]MCX7560554.1 DUF1403 family protein [Sulfitobacter sp. F26204]
MRSQTKLPAWVTSGRAETLETVAFRSGSALTLLDALMTHPEHGVPVKLFANSLALKAATATSKLEGRLAREVDIRDAFHLTPPGDAQGPDGQLLAFWRDAARVPLKGLDRHAACSVLVGKAMAADFANWLEIGQSHSLTHGPLAACVAIMRAVLAVDERAERMACLASDMVLARYLNWPKILPVSARYLTKAMLRELGDDRQRGDLVAQQCILRSAEAGIQLARDLAERSWALRAIAPKLRAKGAAHAVCVFLSEDAVAPSAMLSPVIQGSDTPMTDRAARRFCDRLVELGVARELTGRPTFRLYGIAS